VYLRAHTGARATHLDQGLCTAPGMGLVDLRSFGGCLNPAQRKSPGHCKANWRFWIPGTKNMGTANRSRHPVMQDIKRSFR